MAAAARSTRSSRRRDNEQMDLWLFARQVYRHSKTKPQLKKDPRSMTNAERNAMRGRTALLCIESPTKGQPQFGHQSHMVSTLVGFKDSKYMVHARNISGEPDGKPAAEDSEDLTLLPQENDVIELKNGKKVRVVEYNLASNWVHIEPANKPKRKANAASSRGAKKRKKAVSDKSKKAGSDKSKKNSDKSKKKASGKSTKKPCDKSKGRIMLCTPAVKRKDLEICICCPPYPPCQDSMLNKSKQKSKAKQADIAPRRKKKALDKPTTSSTESLEESGVFTVHTVLKSFTNPRDDLFNRSSFHNISTHIWTHIYYHTYMDTHVLLLCCNMCFRQPRQNHPLLWEGLDNLGKTTLSCVGGPRQPRQNHPLLCGGASTTSAKPPSPV